MSGSKVVICKDLEEALRMLAAGLMLARRGNGSWADPEEYGFDDSNNLKRAYGGLGWEPSEFGYRVDDDG